MNRFPYVAALLFASFGATALAQNTVPAPAAARHAHNHSHDPHKQAAHLSRRLNLSPNQTAQVEPILADRNARIRALRSNTALSEGDRRAQMHAVRRDTRQRLGGVLTPEQRAQMHAMHHHHSRMQPSGAAA